MGNIDWEGMRSDLLALVSKGKSTPDGLRQLVNDTEIGLFDEPKITVTLPRHPSDSSGTLPLQWLPADFVPTQLQAQVISRLSVSGQLPRPSFVIASAGEGRSRAIWLPMLDHCARQVIKDRVGVKALVLYPTRAAALEDAARVAELCRSVDGFRGLRAGVLVGDTGVDRSMGPSNLIDSLDVLGESPVDVLLTTPRILDRTLKDQRYHRVWNDTPPASLRYVVVDSIERYDDQQVTDLAVLLRRLGASLHMASRTQPLPGAVPVLTAAIDYLPNNPSAAPSTPAGSDRGTGSTMGHSTATSPLGPVDNTSQADLPKMDTAGGFNTRGAGGRSLFGKREESRGTELADIGPLRGLGRFIFGEDFGEDSVVAEYPITVDDVCPDTDASSLIPSPADVLKASGDDEHLLTLLFGSKLPSPGDELGLAVSLRSHPLVAALLEATTGPNAGVTAKQVAAYISTSFPSWDPGAVHGDVHRERSSRESVNTASAAVLRLVGLLGRARVTVGMKAVPMVEVLVEQRIRPLPRIMSSVGAVSRYGVPGSVPVANPRTLAPPPPAPRRTSVDGGGNRGSADREEPREHFLPAIACRNCDSTGWLAAILGHDRLLATMPARIDLPFGHQQGNLAVVMLDHLIDGSTAPEVTYLNLQTLRLEPVGSERKIPADHQRMEGSVGENADQTPQQRGADIVGSGVPVRYYVGSSDVAQRLCPSCGRKGSVDFIGATVDDLTTRVTQYLGNEGCAGNDTSVSRGSTEDKLKVLVVTGSVATAERQMEALSAGSYSAHLLSLLSASLVDGPSDPQRLAAALVAAATTPDDRYHLAPTDLRRDQSLASLWTDAPDQADLAVLRERLAYEIGLQVGIDSVEVSSLVGSDQGTVAIEVGMLDPVRDVIAAELSAHDDDPVELERVDRYIDGLLERLRLNGAIRNPLLETFIREGGDAEFITEKRPPGLPTVNEEHWPRFLTTAVTSSLDSVTAIHQHAGGPRTWLVEWACSVLGVNAADAPALNWATMDALAAHSDAVFAIDSLDGHRVYGLEPGAIHLTASAIRNRDGAGHGRAAGHKDSGPATRTGEEFRANATFGHDVDAVARMEWEFQYGTDDIKPDVLVIAPDEASVLQSSEEVLEPLAALSTSRVDTALVDVVVVAYSGARVASDQSPVRQSGRGGVLMSNHLSRVGSTRGVGVVISLSPDHVDQPREMVLPGKYHTETDGWGQDGSDLDEHPSAEQLGLPAVPPDGLQIETSAYIDFLLDRMGDGTLHFRYPLGSIASLMLLADTVPDEMVLAADRAEEEAAERETQKTAEADTQVQYQVPKGVNAPIFVADETTSALQHGRKSDDLIPEEFAPKRRGVFSSLILGSSEKSDHVEHFLEVMSNHVDESRAAELRDFADSGVEPMLESIRAAWKHSTLRSDDSGASTRAVDPDMFWVDGLVTLMNAAGAHERMAHVDDQDLSAPGGGLLPVAPDLPPPSGAPVMTTVHGESRTPLTEAHRASPAKLTSGKASEGGLPTEVSVLLPVLDIQGFERANSAAAAMALGLTTVFCGPDHPAVGGLPLIVTARACSDRDSGVNRWYLSIRPNPNGDLELARSILSALVDKEGVKPVVEAARKAIEDCRHEGPSTVGYLLNEVTRMSLVAIPAEDDPYAVEFAIDGVLAMEVLDSMSEHPPLVVAGLPVNDSDLELLQRRELVRAFVLALAAWIDRDPDVEGALAQRLDSVGQNDSGDDAGSDGAILYEFSFTFAGVHRRYLLTVPDWSRSTPNGVPTVTIEPIGTCAWPIVALQLHITDHDYSSSGSYSDHEGAQSGRGQHPPTDRLNWAVTWADLNDFYDAATNSEASDVTEHVLFTEAVRTWIRDTTAPTSHVDAGTRHGSQEQSSAMNTEALEQNAFALLLDILARPDRQAWASTVGIVAASIAAVVPSAVSGGSGDPKGVYRSPGGADLTVDRVDGQKFLRIRVAGERTLRRMTGDIDDVGGDRGTDQRLVADLTFWSNVLELQGDYPSG